MTNRVMAKSSSVCLEGGDGKGKMAEQGKMAERFGDDEFRSVFALPKALRHTSISRAGANECFGDE
jgi:hypothetical protein